MRAAVLVPLQIFAAVIGQANGLATSFHGSPLAQSTRTTREPPKAGCCNLYMRKQKASDKRTARMQKGLLEPSEPMVSATTQVLSSTPMTARRWKHKQVEIRANGDKPSSDARAGGRGRARKRTKLYNSLASYHSTFLDLISKEYELEEAEVVNRLEQSLADPYKLETSGHALFDVHPSRRGSLFNDEVYRLEKSRDATTTFFTSAETGLLSPLPPNHNFAKNDVIVLTLQPRGNGDFLGTSSLPTNKDATSVEARVLNVGPTYVDVAIPAGKFSTAFGPASNNVGDEGRGDPNMRVRVDRFFSNVPFVRMVAALGQLTSIDSSDETDKRVGGIQMDNLLKEVILSTFRIKDESMLDEGMTNPSLGELPKKLAKPPLPTSGQLTKQVMAFIDADPQKLFPKYNEPQLTAIRCALTRRLTLIQGPPGTGKTTTAGSIAFGFVHQSRSLSPNCKVLATAFSNVGADNLAEKFIALGLKVVRVGKPASVSESLWSHTLEAAIERDPTAQKALSDAARLSAKFKREGLDVKRRNKGALSAERAKRDLLTDSVKSSIQACNIAATRALRQADVIVSTAVGAADGRLLAACGIYPEDEDDVKSKDKPQTPFGTVREFAPDNLPPLTLPFVIIDEACQSVEPASLIPIVSTNSCRSLVLLGDPCQLPPTVRSDTSSTGESPLSVSLMSRLASVLPLPVTVTAQKDNTQVESRFIECKPTRQAVSKVRPSSLTYRRQYAGSLLLSLQYRSHPSIAAFSSAVFYNGLLSSPTVLNELRQFPPHLSAVLPSANADVSVKFVPVGGRNNESREAIKAGVGDLETDPSNKSYRNDAEAAEVIDLIASLLNKNSGFQGSIGVISPYSSQVALIKSMMARSERVREFAKSYPHEIEVKSVDAYQGRERDLIIFSAVRSNHEGRIGFLKDWRRMNVAITRAKNGLVVFGDAETLREGDRHWNAFVNWCDSMGCFVER